VPQAFRILHSDPNVKAILINIFGGIMRCGNQSHFMIAFTATFVDI
jgi:succinyl-CoA synthetase beta subunit